MKLGYECQFCGKAAFYLHVKPNPYSSILARHAYAREGAEQPRRGHDIRCQWCDKGQIPPLKTKNVTEFDE